jgi:bifunctional non-homologous end joining protein LigD
MIHVCAVGGWIEPRGSRPFFAALLLGLADDQDELRYVGRVASGFTDAQLGLVWKQMHGLRRRTSPFTVEPPVQHAHWVKPQLLVRVQYSGWTKVGRLLRPVFAGLESNGTRDRRHAHDRSVAAETPRRS